MNLQLTSFLCSSTAIVSLTAAAVSAGNLPQALFADSFESISVNPSWALEETFDGDPASPSQALLPDTMDFVVTHRTHPRDHLPVFSLFPADHDQNCAGPTPMALTGLPAPQHMVRSTHASSGRSPDQSFFVCKNHMMSAMGDIEGYSVSAFYPRQSFDFSDGGVLEFDVNINDGHPRSWWEIMIAPREQLKLGAAREWLPIDETYSRDRIVLDFSANSRRAIAVGSGGLAPEGWIVNESDWRDWRFIDPDDPALVDRRTRRTMRIELSAMAIRWGVEMGDGEFDWYEVEVPGGLPFSQGIVMFKTHAYTPTKDDNFDQYTFHWDNLRFDGPVTGRFQAFETEQLVYLQSNGNRPIGDTAQATIDLPEDTALVNPTLVGQLHGPLSGQVELSINGGSFQTVDPLEYNVGDRCLSGGWSTFTLPLNPAELVEGNNTLDWRVGPRPSCASGDLDFYWDGFSVKSLEIQSDL